MEDIAEMSMDEYLEDALTKVQQYKEGVKSGKIIAGEYIKKLIDFADDLEPEFEINEEAVSFVFYFLSKVRTEKDEKYCQLVLEPFQAYLVYYVFGTYYKGTDRKRYSTSLLLMGRKNGKTSLTVALTLYVLLSGEWANPQSIIVSTVEARAQIINDLHKMILNSPEIEPYLLFSRSMVYINNSQSSSDGGERKLKKLKDEGFCKVVPNNAKKLDSFKLASAIFDEVHTFRNWDEYLTAQKGTGARKNSILMMISTAGFIPDGFLADFVSYSKDIIDGKVKNKTVFPMLFLLDKGDEKKIHEMDVWRKANPGLGTILNTEKVKQWYAEAKYNPKAKADFLTKTLNIFLDSDETSLLEKEKIDQAVGVVNEEKWYGKPCWIGIDLSKTNDLSCVLCLFHDEEDDTWEVIPYFFMVNKPKLFDRPKNINLRDWMPPKNNYLIRCPGESMDYGMIAELLVELNEKFDVKGIGYDPLGWSFVSDKLGIYNLGIDENDIVAIRQGPMTMAGALIYLIKLFHDKRINIGNNPVMRWTMRNAVIKVADSNNNPKLFKNKRMDSDEGAVALNNAMTLYYKLELDPDRQGF